MGVMQNSIDGGVIQMEGYCHHFSLDEIRRGTKCFDDGLIIGTGGASNVYKGIINNGGTTAIVAIKRFNAKSKQGAEEFWSEVKLISKFQHTNIVRLIGYCNEDQEMILVYEYIARGTLASHLYKSSGEETSKSNSHLTWEQRLEICLGVACGLDYLHTSTEQPIIHRDVKSTNILLDHNWVAKVSDFGISKCITSQTTTHVRTKFKGTIGYWDPHYFYTNRVNRKADVYGFGVVLLEVLCGRPVVDTKLERGQINLILWAKKHIENGKLDRIIDPSLKGETPPHDSIKYFAEVANKCLHTDYKERPTMAEVVNSLAIALVSHEGKVTSRGSIAKGKRSWWRDGGGPSKHSSLKRLLDNLTQSAYRRFSLADIRAATDNFSGGYSIGQGIFYGGCTELLGGMHGVGIIRYQLKTGFYQLMTGLDFNELVCAKIQVQFLTHHPNIVSNLIGFCNEEHELILVYDNVLHSTLESHLAIYQPSWEKRLQICIDIACGIKFLHTNVEQQAIHGNIRTSNIDLDKTVAKIGGFEHSIPIRNGLTTKGLETVVRGKDAYLDPEYFCRQAFTKKSDVYSFGVVLLEVLSGKGPQNLLRWLYELLEKGTIVEAIPPYLLGEIAPKCFGFFVCLALSCVVDEGIRRPSMDDVLCSLQSLLQLQQAWENPFQMGKLYWVDVYNEIISLNTEFTIGGQSFLIYDLVRQWNSVSSSF